MNLLTSHLHNRLLANGRRRGLDRWPLAKFFSAVGAGTWLATELDADALFGLANLGFASPEPGQLQLAQDAIDPAALRPHDRTRPLF